jgi:hypothetical protein
MQLGIEHEFTGFGFGIGSAIGTGIGTGIGIGTRTRGGSTIRIEPRHDD